MSGVPITVEGAERLRKELLELKTKARPRIIQAIAEARAHGDLKENAEYHAAKERQGHVNARLGQLRKRLAQIALVNFNNIPRDRVAFGSTVVVHDVAKGTEVEYKIVVSEETDVAKGKISTSSPIGSW